MAAAAAEAGVTIVTGDTKVVERGRADGVYINTSGIGLVPPGLEIGGSRARPGDVVLLSGSVGDHGIAVVSQREGLRFHTTVRSDAAPLNRMAAALVAAALESGEAGCLRTMRDPTRGGLATTLNELARQSRVAIAVDESAVPVHAEVRAACEMLGYDPMYVANEGKLVAVVAPEWAGSRPGGHAGIPVRRRGLCHRQGGRRALRAGDAADRHRWHSHPGHVERRAAAAHLLMPRPGGLT